MARKMLQVLLVASVFGLAHCSCSIQLVESMPENMTYPTGSEIHPATYKAWTSLLLAARNNITISSFYWTLRSSDIPHSPKHWPAAEVGADILKLLLKEVGRINLTIVNNGSMMSPDLSLLKKAGAAVHLLDVQRLLNAGILHTKMWTVDDLHGYVGSANMDWRSLMEVKEIGLVLFDCPVMVREMKKVQEVYKMLSGPSGSIPKTWPKAVQTKINSTHPFVTTVGGVRSEVFLSASPPPFTPPGRSDDAETIVSIMGEAKKFIFVAVMDYFPLIQNYTGSKDVFWPHFDDAFKAAAINKGVQVRLLVSHWLHTSKQMWNYMRSLKAISGPSVDIQVKYFEVPNFANFPVPFTRVAHNKYMVTDNTVYMGTSNWSGNYFTKSCGVGFVVREISPPKPCSLRGQLEEVFRRDWNSPFAKPVY